MQDPKRLNPLPKERLRKLKMTQRELRRFMLSREYSLGLSTLNYALNNWHEATVKTRSLIETALQELEGKNNG